MAPLLHRAAIKNNLPTDPQKSGYHLINFTSPWIEQPYFLVLTCGNQFAAIPVP